MFILTRRVGQQIVIDDAIVLTVVEITRGQIRLGFEAPAGRRIVRREVYTGSLPQSGGGSPAAGSPPADEAPPQVPEPND